MDNHRPELLSPDFARLLLKSMADGVFTLDTRGRITSWNPSMELITGFTAKEAIGKPCTMLNFNRCFGGKCPAGIHECEIFSHGSVDGKECFLCHKSGNNIPVFKNARLIKDHNGKVQGIVETITNLSELYQARLFAEAAGRRLGEIHRLDNIIGESNVMHRVFSAIKAAAVSEATILVQGESGTGKELVAGAIHYNSSRADKPFVTVNCSALAESLLESELFGHVKGAFTDANRDRTGRFEEADGGTLFLDEIGEISPLIQVKLLRAIQEREVERVGESKKRKINIRIVTASNRDLYELVKRGEFREDLYYRLKVFPIDIPPLCQRKVDIPPLARHFINIQNKKTGKQISSLTQSAMRILLDYNWPGNIRELENAIEHAFVLCTDEHIDIFDLPVEIRQMEYRGKASYQSVHIHDSKPEKRKLTREFLIDVLEDSDWNKAEVGRRVGLSRASIWKYMKKWDIPMKKP